MKHKQTNATHYNDSANEDDIEQQAAISYCAVMNPRFTMRALLDLAPLSHEQIREILRSAGFATDIHDGAVFVLMSEAPVVVRHIKGAHFIDLFTTLPTRPGVCLRPMLNFLNTLNSKIPLVRFYLKERTQQPTFHDPRITLVHTQICAEASVLAKGGNLNAQLPASLNAFIRGVDLAAKEGIKAGFVDLPAPRRMPSRGRSIRATQSNKKKHGNS